MNVRTGASVIAWVGAGLGEKRVVHEALGAQFGAVQVAPGHAGAADADFAGDAQRHRLQLGVENVDVRVGDGFADRQHAAVAGLAAVDGGANGRLGRAVGVEEAVTLRPLGRQRRGAGVAGHDQGQGG